MPPATPTATWWRSPAAAAACWPWTTTAMWWLGAAMTRASSAWLSWTLPTKTPMWPTPTPATSSWVPRRPPSTPLIP